MVSSRRRPAKAGSARGPCRLWGVLHSPHSRLLPGLQRKSKAFRPGLGIEGLLDPHRASPAFPLNFLLLLQLCDLGQVIRPVWALISWSLPELFPDRRRSTSPTALMMSSVETCHPACASPAKPPFNVAATSEHVHSSASAVSQQGLGAGEAAGPAGQVLGRDCELATDLSHQQIFAGPGEGESQPIKCHIVRGT